MLICILSNFDEKLLIELDKFLSFEDEVILNFYHHDIIENQIDKNAISKIFKNSNFDGGEGGIRTHERVAPLLVFKTSAFNRSATSPNKLGYFNTIKELK